MKKIVFIIGTLVLVCSSIVEAKPIVVSRGRVPEAILDRDTEKLAKASQACHLQKHLGAHTSYVQKQVFPRIERELKQILAPQQGANGETFYISESVDYGDLFHAHIRDPLSLIPAASASLNPQFSDSREYHLQYHSYEYMEYMQINWLRQLQGIDHPDLQSWLKARQEYIEAQNSAGGQFGNYGSGRVETGLKILTDEQRNAFGRLWHDHLGPKSPGFSLLIEKLRYLDPKDLKLGSTLLAHRSVVSTDEKFIVIDPLNLKDHWQPATVYFEELKDAPAVQAVIERAKALGLKRIINVKSKYFLREAFPKETSLDLHAQMMKELAEAAQKTTAQDPLYMFGHAFEGPVDIDGHVVVGWSEKYLFSIRYFLPCNEKEQALADSVTEPRRFPIPRP